MLIRGRCHCGNIAFSLNWSPSPTEIPARACGCSFCIKHGGVWTSCPTGFLTVLIKDRHKFSTYAFGTRYSGRTGKIGSGFLRCTITVSGSGASTESTIGSNCEREPLT
jgi:hypothetical protein